MRNPFRYFNSSPEVIRLTVRMYIRYPLSLRQVEDRRCQSKILNTCSGHRTAQIDPEKCTKINGREIRF
jgi:transposase-like protein